MSRHSIFDILAGSWDLKNELQLIAQLFACHDSLHTYRGDFSVEGYIDNYLFSSWASRGTSISTARMKQKLGMIYGLEFDYVNIKVQQGYNVMLLRLEYILNMIYLVDRKKLDDTEYLHNYLMLKSNLNQLLEHINHKTITDDKAERVLLVPNDAAVTAVAEIVDDSTVPYLLQYHHFLLKGDIQSKSSILSALGSQLEPKRKELAQRDSNLCNAGFFYAQ